MPFEKTMTQVFDCMVIAAIPSALLSIFGVVLMAHPRLLQDDKATAIYFACTQLILSVVVLFIGGYVANSIRGYQTLFEEFDVRASHLPYYGMMHYGGIGEAVFGSLVIILSLQCSLFCDIASPLYHCLYVRASF
jgi:ABC-type phosphate transport system permease subunit